VKPGCTRGNDRCGPPGDRHDDSGAVLHPDTQVPEGRLHPAYRERTHGPGGRTGMAQAGTAAPMRPPYHPDRHPHTRSPAPTQGTHQLRPHHRARWSEIPRCSRVTRLPICGAPVAVSRMRNSRCDSLRFCVFGSAVVLRRFAIHGGIMQRASEARSLIALSGFAHRRVRVKVTSRASAARAAACGRVLRPLCEASSSQRPESRPWQH